MQKDFQKSDQVLICVYVYLCMYLYFCVGVCVNMCVCVCVCGVCVCICMYRASCIVWPHLAPIYPFSSTSWSLVDSYSLCNAFLPKVSHPLLCQNFGNCVFVCVCVFIHVCVCVCMCLVTMCASVCVGLVDFFALYYFTQHYLSSLSWEISWSKWGCSCWTRRRCGRALMAKSVLCYTLFLFDTATISFEDPMTNL
jgi:hypothetical protein